MKIIHPIAPLYSPETKVLILGSFPSVKSREYNFFYGHPQNRFWHVIAAVFDSPIPLTVEEKKKLILEKRLGLWDVIGSCEIKGSADASIKNALPNDISPILSSCNIRRIFVNGRTAEEYYNKYILPACGRTAVCLPSTSPANAAWSLEKLIGEWKQIAEFTGLY